MALGRWSVTVDGTLSRRSVVDVTSSLACGGSAAPTPSA
jgi:hypothetical protein